MSNGQSSDFDALLRAVCENPDDDAPRLAYADALDATGDPNDALRAEYIRVKCELDRRDYSRERWLMLIEREEALKVHHERWIDELPKLAGVEWSSIYFPRGFAWDVTCDDAAVLRRHAAAIFSAAPIQSLSFCRLTSVVPIVDLSEMLRVRRMILQRFGLTEVDARAMADSPHLNDVTHLHLTGNRFGDAGAKAFASARFLRSLVDIDLGENGIGDAGAAALATSPIAANLEHLGSAENPLTDAGALALAASPHFQKLSGMTLWGCKKIRKKGKAALKARFGDVASFED